MMKRKNLDDFQIQTRQFFNLIRASYHLDKVRRGPLEYPAPKFLKAVKWWLSRTICPAIPRDRTALVLKGNAENWLQVALQTLMEHHLGTIRELKVVIYPSLSGEWEEAWRVAVGWIRKRFPHIKDQLLESIWRDLDNNQEIGDHPVAAAPPPPSSEGRNLDLDQSPPRKKHQPGPQNQPVTPRELTDMLDPSGDLFDSVGASGEVRSLVWALENTEGLSPPPPKALSPPFGRGGGMRSGLRVAVEKPSPPPLISGGALPGRSEPLTRADFDLSPSPPSPPLELFTYHPHGGNKDRNWSLEPRRRILVIGDSNISRLPLIMDEWVQVDCFPGASIAQAAHLLKRNTPTSGIVERVILSFGINDRHRGNTSLVGDSLGRLVSAAKATFPNALVHIPVVNGSGDLGVAQRVNLHYLNGLIKNIPDHIPRLVQTQFEVVGDKIHWTAFTGAQMWNHWRLFLGQRI